MHAQCSVLLNVFTLWLVIGVECTCIRSNVIISPAMCMHDVAQGMAPSGQTDTHHPIPSSDLYVCTSEVHRDNINPHPKRFVIVTFPADGQVQS